MNRRPPPRPAPSPEAARAGAILGGLVLSGVFIALGVTTFSYGSANGWFGIICGGVVLLLLTRSLTVQTPPPRPPVTRRKSDPHPTHQVPIRRADGL